MMTFIAQHPGDLTKALALLPDDMRVDVADGLPIKAATVGELRHADALASGILISIPRLRQIDSVVMVRTLDRPAG